MRIKQDISRCLSDRIGEAGLTQAELEAAVERAGQAVTKVRQMYTNGQMPLLDIPDKTDDLDDFEHAAETLTKGATDIVLLGTGGSSLGAQALAQLAGFKVSGIIPFRRLNNRTIRMHFLDNLDAGMLEQALIDQDMKTTSFLVVSKSGGTAETVMQMIIMLEGLKERGLDWNAKAHMVVITETGDLDANAILQMARRHDLEVLEHSPTIGGRYSVLTNVGLLPAQVMGLDVKAVRRGAKAAVMPLLGGNEAADIPAALGAAVNVALMEEKGITTTVMMPYCDRLRFFANWFQQLWAESIGKEGRGSTPLGTAGPVDQHSLMQLFLDGPADKLLNIIQLPTAGEGPKIPDFYRSDPLIGYLAGRTVGDLTDCQQRATAETFANNNRPVRVFKIDGIEEEQIGELMMHFMLETIITGYMMGIDPFDQPAVEQSKVLTREYLKSM
ncbi:Glucose-6-phosphate isomerase [hydrothermal vent metagenome]|uniref:glucose-6-phosphate isomerase n=1 Tax=hydrothermal vent metagenome TaxID=652676 RepID=A0A3B0RR60_9ZZZZ